MTIRWGVLGTFAGLLVAGVPACSSTANSLTGGNASGNRACPGTISPASASVDVGGAVPFSVSLDVRGNGPTASSPATWTTSGGGHFQYADAVHSGATFVADGPPGSYMVTDAWTTPGGDHCSYQAPVTVSAGDGSAPALSDAGPAADTGVADASATPATCNPLDITSVSPGTGPLGTGVQLSGSGFRCLKYLDFKTSSDIHTFARTEFAITGDDTIDVAIPAADDAKQPMQYMADCIGQFDMLSTDPKQPTARATFTISGTGTAICP